MTTDKVPSVKAVNGPGLGLIARMAGRMLLHGANGLLAL